MKPAPCAKPAPSVGRRALPVLAAALLAAALAGCQPAAPSPTASSPHTPTATAVAAAPQTATATASPTSAPPTATPTPAPSLTPTPIIIPGGRVVHGGLEPVRYLNPLAGDLNAAEQSLADLLFEGLLTLDPLNGDLQPGLAERWSFSADGLRVTFWLRPGLKWHDGAPLQAVDVVRSLNQAMDRLGGARLWPVLAPVAEVRAVADNQVTVQFAEADCRAFWALTQVKVLPERLVAERLAVDQGVAEPTAVGSGPFRWAGQEENGALVLAAYTEHWQHSPYLDAWVYQAYPDAASLSQALEAGAVDVALGASPGVPGYTVQPLPGDSYLVLLFNTGRTFLRDAAVRQTLSGLLDRPRLLQEVAGVGQVWDAPLPPGHWALPAGMASGSGGDPQAARRALERAGWGDEDGDGYLEYRGRAVTLAVETNQENDLRVGTALRVAGQLREAGLAAEVHQVEWGSLLSDLERQDYDLAVLSLPLHAEPANCTLWRPDTGTAGEPFDWTGGDQTALLEALEQAQAAPGCGSATRAGLYAAAWAWLEREKPYQFLFSPARALAKAHGLGGLAASPFLPWNWNAHYWYWAAGPG
ncbi:MAG: hypothetical protein GX605_02585 [Chloroflexi bacterium]|nr:hypothetical protein [Chloroflexota bacterium]